MTRRKGTAGIVDAIRHGTTQALSDTLDFLSRLPTMDAALLAAIVCGVIGWRQYG